MAKIGKFRAASNIARRYGSTRSHRSASSRSGVSADSVFDDFEASFRSIDTIKSEEQNSVDNFSCAECCRAVPETLFNFTIGACISCCLRPKENESTSSVEDIHMVDLKEKLRFHFMNPFEKWRYHSKRRFPWKLAMQLLSIILVTLQVALFARSKFALTDFLQQNKRTFAKLFIVDPADPLYSNPVPDPISVIYTNEALLNQLNHTAIQYFNLEKVAAGPYGYQWEGNYSIQPHLHLLIRRHKSGIVNPTKKIFDVSSSIVTDFYNIANRTDPINDALDWDKLQAMLPKVLDIHLNFNVSSVYIPDSITPKCYQFCVTFSIQNNLEKGNMPMSLDTETKMSACDNDSEVNAVDVDSGVLSDTKSTVIDGVVIVVSLVSIVLCARSVVRSFKLSKEVRAFFIKHFEWKLRIKHFLPLFNWWFVMIIVSNALVLVGSVTKVIISYTNPDSLTLVDVTSLIIGLAVFGQWCGLLRFLSYFDKYNMLLITLRLAMPSVLRFFVCAGILYIAFLLLGWLVLGSYHPKFTDPSTTSECLFSLLNGDDMFQTYLEMSHTSLAAYIFSKVYLYTFISLFIYVVLSVFISLISDTYETLHDHWKNRQRGLLKDFATDQLGRGHCDSGSHHSHHSMVEGDTADYKLMRDIAVSSEHQPLFSPGTVNGGPEVRITQPTAGSQDTTSNDRLRPDTLPPTVKLGEPTIQST